MENVIQNKKMLCVAGQNDIAVDLLVYLQEHYGNSYELCTVCNKRETGKNGWQKSLRFFAQKLKIKEYRLDELYGIEKLIFLSLEFDRIIKPELFLTKEFYNVHFSKLPAYKGCNTSVIPLLHAEKEVGVTLHRINSGIDTGEIIDQRNITVANEDTALDLYKKYVKEGTEIIIANLPRLLSGVVESRPQQIKGSTFYMRSYINYEKDKEINLKQTADQIRNQVRAYCFRPYQLPRVMGKEVVWVEVTGTPSEEKCGTVLEQDKKSVLISTIDYNVRIFFDRLQELLEACKVGSINTVREITTIPGLLKASNEKGWNALIVATFYNQVEIVRYLIQNGGDLSSCNINGKNLLMYATDTYIRTGDDNLIKMYIHYGLEIEKKDYDGKSVMDYLMDSLSESALTSKKIILEKIADYRKKRISREWLNDMAEEYFWYFVRLIRNESDKENVGK